MCVDLQVGSVRCRATSTVVESRTALWSTCVSPSVLWPTSSGSPSSWARRSRSRCAPVAAATFLATRWRWKSCAGRPSCSPSACSSATLAVAEVIIYTIILLMDTVTHLTHLTSVALICGLYRPSSEPIASPNVLKCPTRHALQTIRFWHFSSAALIVKKLKNAVLRHRSVNEF